MDDKQIIDLYWARSESAIAETAAKYGSFCHRIAYNILASREDSEECVNDTYLKTWEAIPPRRPTKLAAFLGKITRNLALNRYVQRKAEKRGGGQVPLALEELAECVPDPDSVERRVDDRFLAEMFNVFLSRLPEEARKVFLLRYWSLYPVRDIAAACAVSESKVKMSLMRTRKKLRTFLEQEGIEL